MIVAKEMQPSMLALLFASALAAPSVYKLGQYNVNIGDTDRLLVVSRGKDEVLASLASHEPFLAAAHGPWETTTRQGNVNFTDAIVSRSTVQTIDRVSSGGAGENATLKLEGKLSGSSAAAGNWSYALLLQVAPAPTAAEDRASRGMLHFSVTCHPAQALVPSHSVADGANLRRRLVAVWARGNTESFFGLGKQYTYLDASGQRVPIMVGEQGVGRGRQPVTRVMNALGGAGGNAFTTYSPSPLFLTSALRGMALDAAAYAAFDFTKPNRFEVDLLQPPDHGSASGLAAAGYFFHSLGSAASPLDLLQTATEITGRMQPLPSWVDGGAVIGMEGGTDAVRAEVESLRASDVPLAGVWMQDWSGTRHDAFGTRLWWNWQLDAAQYPAWDQLVADLNATGTKVLTYINPYLANNAASAANFSGRDLFQEARSLGFLVRNSSGDPYILASGSDTFTFGTVDLTSPAAAAWLRDVIRCNMLGDAGGCPNNATGTAKAHPVAGVSGWMADFAEYLPFDAVLASGERADEAHNRFPELWAAVNRDALRAAGRDGDGDNAVAFFTRSGFLRAPRSATLAWAGDQLVTWDGDDGLRSALTCALSSGVSGYTLSHSDIGGYTMLNITVPQSSEAAAAGAMAPEVLQVLRSRELLMRWMELSAFSDALFRTHPGNLPELSAQWNSDAGTKAQLRRMARVYRALAPYRRSLMSDAAARGAPLARMLWLTFPADEDARARQSQTQFTLGEELLVAPVLDAGATTVLVYFPALPSADGQWVNLWSGNAVPGTGTRAAEVRVAAPMGSPPVFYRERSRRGAAIAQAVSEAVHAAPATTTAPLTCNVTQGFDFVGDDLLDASGRCAPQPCPNASACCSMCAHKDPARAPFGACSAWSFNAGSSTCWLKNGTGKATPRQSDTSGVVVMRHA